MQDMSTFLDHVELIGTAICVAACLIYMFYNVFKAFYDNFVENRNRRLEKKTRIAAEEALLLAQFEKKKNQNRFVNFSEWDRKDQINFYRKSFEELQQNYQGTLKGSLETDKTVALCITTLHKRIRIILNSKSGNVSLLMRFTNRCGLLKLYYKEGKLPQNDQNLNLVRQSNKDKCMHVFAPGVYIKEECDEIQSKIALVEKLSVSLRETMFAWLINNKVNSMEISKKAIELRLREPFYLMNSPQKKFDEAFILMNDIATHFSKGLAPLAVPNAKKSEIVISASGIFINGKPIHELNQKITCTYCQTTYIMDKNHARCPSCGAASAKA